MRAEAPTLPSWRSVRRRLPWGRCGLFLLGIIFGCILVAFVSELRVAVNISLDEARPGAGSNDLQAAPGQHRHGEGPHTQVIHKDVGVQVIEEHVTKHQGQNGGQQVKKDENKKESPKSNRAAVAATLNKKKADTNVKEKPVVNGIRAPPGEPTGATHAPHAPPGERVVMCSQEERVDHLEAYCERYRKTKEFRRSDPDLRYRRSRARPVFFCATSMKRHPGLFRQVAAAVGVSAKPNDMRDEEYGLERRLKSSANVTFRSFVIVRHPMALLGTVYENLFRRKQNEHVRALNALLGRNGTAAGGKPTFGEFLQLVLARRHDFWNPLARTCHPCAMPRPWTELIRVETGSEDVARLNETVRFRPAGGAAAAQRELKWAKGVPASLLESVLKRLEFDLAPYGYSYDIQQRLLLCRIKTKHGDDCC